jgi:hypothetical protein
VLSGREQQWSREKENRSMEKGRERYSAKWYRETIRQRDRAAKENLRGDKAASLHISGDFKKSVSASIFRCRH